MKPLQLLVLTATFLVAHTAAAARPNYTYLGAAYATDRLDADCDRDGLFVEGSLVVNELSFVRVKHSDLTSDTWCGSTSTAIGAGVRSDVGGSSSIYATASMVRRDFGRNAELGLAADLGVRSFVAYGLEVTGFLGYEAIDDFEVTRFGGGVNYWVSQTISITAAVTFDDDEGEEAQLGLRYNF